MHVACERSCGSFSRSSTDRRNAEQTNTRPTRHSTNSLLGAYCVFWPGLVLHRRARHAEFKTAAHNKYIETQFGVTLHSQDASAENISRKRLLTNRQKENAFFTNAAWARVLGFQRISTLRFVVARSPRSMKKTQAFQMGIESDNGLSIQLTPKY